MILIRKGQEPQSLTQYKQQRFASYDELPTRTKDEIRDALLREQGYICSYCMCRIKLSDMRIEHYIPQSVNANLALDYKNMLGVCFGNSKDNVRCGNNKKKYLTCDAHRGEDVLEVNPLDETSMSKIKYKEDGTIYSEDSNINKDLNETLNLNCNEIRVQLKSNRKAALEALKQYLKNKGIRQGKWTKDFLISVKNQFLNGGGKNKAYRGIMEFYINKRLSRS